MPEPLIEDLEEPAPDYLGHRARLRDRFLKTNGEGFAEYELVELLLMIAVPRRDVKPLAKALIQRFGTFSNVINASENELLSITGIGDTSLVALKFVKVAALHLMRQSILDKPVLNSWTRLMEYLTAAMAHEPVEHFRVLFLDKRNHLIADEVQQRGTVDHTPVYPREVIKRALELSATAIILVHNHPSGDPTPSRSDIDMTKEIIKAATPIGITVHDHIIVGKTGTMSFKSSGLM